MRSTVVFVHSSRHSPPLPPSLVARSLPRESSFAPSVRPSVRPTGAFVLPSVRETGLILERRQRRQLAAPVRASCCLFLLLSSTAQSRVPDSLAASLLHCVKYGSSRERRLTQWFRAVRARDLIQYRWLFNLVGQATLLFACLPASEPVSRVHRCRAAGMLTLIQLCAAKAPTLHVYITTGGTVLEF